MMFSFQDNNYLCNNSDLGDFLDFRWSASASNASETDFPRFDLSLFTINYHNFRQKTIFMIPRLNVYSENIVNPKCILVSIKIEIDIKILNFYYIIWKNEIPKVPEGKVMVEITRMGLCQKILYFEKWF